MFVHFEKITTHRDGPQIYIARAFAHQLESPELDPQTGQPFNKYCGMCVLVIRNGECEIKGLLSIPTGAFGALYGGIGDLPEKPTAIVGDRWIKREMRIPLNTP